MTCAGGLERCWGMNDWHLPSCLPSLRGALGSGLVPPAFQGTEQGPQQYL